MIVSFPVPFVVLYWQQRHDFIVLPSAAPAHFIKIALAQILYFLKSFAGSRLLFFKNDRGSFFAFRLVGCPFQTFGMVAIHLPMLAEKD